MHILKSILFFHSAGALAYQYDNIYARNYDGALYARNYDHYSNPEIPTKEAIYRAMEAANRKGQPYANNEQQANWLAAEYGVAWAQASMLANNVTPKRPLPTKPPKPELGG
jgi:hypothetical protein